MQVDAQQVVRELSERIAQQEVELATLRVLLRQQAAQLKASDSSGQVPAAKLQESESSS